MILNASVLCFSEDSNALSNAWPGLQNDLTKFRGDAKRRAQGGEDTEGAGDAGDVDDGD